jgi:hypothetical protein
MNVIMGAVVWLVIVVTPWDPQRGLGWIEKLFLLGPLVVVPLGVRMRDEGGRMKWAMFGAALLVVAAFLTPVGWGSGMLTVPWLVGCAWIALRVVAAQKRRPLNLCRTVAWSGLVVGAVGLLESRWGMEPLGFREPWVLLVAVHFHFAAFVTPLITGEVVQRIRTARWPLVFGACAGSPMLAPGYVLDGPVLRLAGASLLVATVWAVAVWSLWNCRRITPVAARGLIVVSAISAVAGMVYAGIYALGDFYGEVWIAIPQMARTHGVLQAVGFSVCGLWGWSLAKQQGGLRSLTRRWQ